MCEVIGKADKLAQLDLRETRLADEDLYTIAGAVSESASISSFRVTIHEDLAPSIGPPTMKEFLELFDVDYEEPKGRDEPKSERVLEFKPAPTPQLSKTSVIDFLVLQSEGKQNKIPRFEPLERIKGAVEVYRLTNFTEIDFAEAQTIQEVRPLTMQDQVW